MNHSLDEIRGVKLLLILVLTIDPEKADVREFNLLVIFKFLLNEFFGKLNIAACFIGLSEFAEVTGIAYFLSKSTFVGLMNTYSHLSNSLKSEDCIPPPSGGRLGS
jgi:hypothetical protein